MSQIAKNIVSNSLNFFIATIIPILLTPFLIHKLGNSHYGLWILINSVIGYYGLLDIGISSSITRYVSKYLADGDESNLNSFINTVLSIFLLMGVVCIIASVILSFFLADLFNLSEDNNILFPRLILVLGFAFALSFFSRVFTFILYAAQRYEIANSIDISCSVIQAIMTVYFLSRGGGLISLGLITSLVKLINGSLHFIFVLRKVPIITIDLKRFQKSKIMVIFKYSVFSFIWMISYSLKFQTSSVVIGAFLSTEAITFYSIGARLMAYYTELMDAICSVTKPIFSSMESQNQSEKISNLLMNGTRYSSAIAIFMGISLILYGKAFIRLWVGEEFDSSYYVMLILIIPYIISASQSMLLSIAYGIGKHKLLSVVSMGESIISILLSILLIKRYGIYGVAVGAVLPFVINKLFVQPIYICRVVSLSISTYIKRGFLYQTFIGIIYIILAKSMMFVFYPNSYVKLLLSISIGFAVFIILFIILCLNSDERETWGRQIAYRAKKIYNKA